MERLVQDVRFAVRSYLKHPAFTLVALLTLALGVGLNTAIFSVVNAIVLQPLPFPAADRLVRVTADFAGLGASDVGMSAPELFDYRDRAGIFEGIAGLYPVNANLTEVDVPERVEVMLVSPEYFDILGARPALGRVFGPDDRHPGIAEVTVISDALWQRRFGGRPDVLGRTVRVDDDSYTIVGVMPPEFRHPGRSLRTDVDLWAPAGYRADPFGPPVRGAYFLSGSIARLQPGVSLVEAERRLQAFAAQLRAEQPSDYPSRAAWTPRIVALQEDVAGHVGPMLLLLFGAVAIVLVIACANIAGLLLARTAARQRELSVRRALGSGRARLIRMLLTESLLVSLAGGALGLLVAVWGLDVLLALVPDSLPRVAEIAINGRVLAFALGVSIATGLLFGLAPVLQFSSPDLLAALKDGRSPSGSSRRTLRAALVVAEFALALVLLVGASLLVRSFWRLQQVDPGLDARNVLTARLWLPRPNDPARGRYLSHPPRLALFEDLLRRMRGLPGVEEAAIVQHLPLDGQRNGTSLTIDGQDAPAMGEPETVLANFASARYFSAMRIPVLAGRGFGEVDGANGARVAVVNQEMVRRYFGGGGAVGRRLKFGGPTSQAPWMTIVGVVGNVPSERLDVGPRPMIYRPMTQATNLSVALVVRTAEGSGALDQAIARAVAGADPDLPAFAVRTMERVMADAAATRRFSMQLVAAFAVLALLLAAIGIYGVMAYLVGQQTREIGIRMALGAKPMAVVRMVVTYALGMAAAGVAGGVVMALLLTGLISGMLFQTSPADPIAFASIAGVLTLTAVVASLSPALRAARVDPVTALRSE